MSRTPRLPLARRHAVLAVLLALLLALGLVLLPSASDAAGRYGRGPRPTVVLVHGAFADASGWAGVTDRLQDEGYPVIAPANPLRGLAPTPPTSERRSSDRRARRPRRPLLRRRGHHQCRARRAERQGARVRRGVRAGRGRDVQDLPAQCPGSELAPDRRCGRASSPTGTDLYIDPASFRAVFAADLPARTAAAMATAQRPGALSTLQEPSGEPAWKTIPSWYLVARQDRAIPPDSERFMARRMNAHTREISSSHVAMISHPGVVADMIKDAARTTR